MASKGLIKQKVPMQPVCMNPSNYVQDQPTSQLECVNPNLSAFDFYSLTSCLKTGSKIIQHKAWRLNNTLPDEPLETNLEQHEMNEFDPRIEVMHQITSFLQEMGRENFRNKQRKCINQDRKTVITILQFN